MVRPCSSPASVGCWQGAPKTRNTPCYRAAYETQLFIQKTYEPLFIDQLGIRPDSPPTSIWKKAGAKQVLLTPEERAVWQAFLSFERHKSRFQPLVERFGKREYEAIARVANSPGVAEQRRWWKA